VVVAQQIRGALDELPPGVPALIVSTSPGTDTRAGVAGFLARGAERLAWMSARRALGYPVLVATAGTAVVGYGTFGDFRAWPGYRYTVEHSVYIHAGHRGRGHGRVLIDELISAAAALGKHVLIAGIDGGNSASIRLHARAGFVEVARMPEVGRKFGRWLDLVFMQRILDAPGAPRPD